MAVADLAASVTEVRPLRRGLILGGTRVHDWFFAGNAIDTVHLTVEPVRFSSGLPVFTEQQGSDPVEFFLSRGFVLREERILNSGGTRFYDLVSSAEGEVLR